MDTKEVALKVAEALNDKQAEDIVVLDVNNVVSYASFFIIASGKTERHVRALQSHIERSAKEYLGRPFSSEGAEGGTWALLDYGDILVHIFRREERAYYDLEGLWRDAPRVPFEPAPVPAPTTPRRF